MTWMQRILVVTGGALLLLSGAPMTAMAQGKAEGVGCAKYREPEKQAKCKANEARAAKDAERKRIDAERKAERTCAAPKDAKMKAECDKKAAAKPK